MVIEDQLMSNMWYSVRKAIERVEISRLWYLGNGRLQDIPMSVPSSGTTHDDIQRLYKRTATVGRSIIDIRRGGAISQVSWETQGNTRLLESLKLQELANKLFNDLFIQGICAVTSYRTINGELRFARLGGYLELIRDSEDTDNILGIMQIIQDSSLEYRYTIRTYTFLGNDRALLRIWGPVSNLEVVFSQRPREELEVSAPSFVSLGDNSDDSSIGEGSALLGLILDYAATSIKIERVADAQAFPILWIKGIVNQFEEVGPNKTFVFDNEGSLNRLEPGDLSQLRNLREDLDAMITSQFSLPGRISGGNFPSGEALKEARLNFTNISRSYARSLTQVLNSGLRIHGSLANTSFPQVAVEPFEVYELNDKLQLAINLYKEGIIPIRAVATLAQQLLPTWSDEELEQFLQKRETQLTPEEAINMLGV